MVLISPNRGKLGTPVACADCHVMPSMTSQCTDQCVVVACSEEDHTICDMQCPGNHCDLVCEDASNCKDCNGFDEFLDCCTDFHSYYEEPRNHPDSTSSWSWDSSLKTFVCSCGGGSRMDCIPPNGSAAFNKTDASFMMAVDPALSTPSTSTPSQHASPEASPPEAPHLACMWGSCLASFTSLSELAEHVNAVHLSRPSPPSPPTTSDSSGPSSMSCQWKDCNIYSAPESTPGPSTGTIDSMLRGLSSHLLHDHLGLNDVPPCFQPDHVCVPPCIHPHLCDVPLPEPAGAALEPVPSTLPSEIESPAVHAGHVCRWISCGQSFGSLDELTQHLTDAHVGAGKTSYDCYWQDCSRHGESGFTSKQKLCRHLQSHTGHRPFQCKVCMQNFSEAATLQQHMRRHTQEKPYMCDYPGCGKSFAITGALTIHKRTHNGEKPFKCPHCEKAFSESSNLSKHLRTHTGGKTIHLRYVQQVLR
ncbi:hypothetical protein MSAN_00707600 [Mycena sanguinolenta]|uniref:C2H2-type domain-containing protein n=1 Tax=Mycena sanguinolenta TaxID=230812 RepID=A0A8H6Z168_9AGAR|nr:hypothetical protein MSAN_00707600 [Mycena sanguinolenta]